MTPEADPVNAPAGQRHLTSHRECTTAGKPNPLPKNTPQGHRNTR